MMLASCSSSITPGAASFTTRTCCSHAHVQVHVHVLAPPNAQSRCIVSLSLGPPLRRKSLDILSSSTRTTLRHLNTPISAVNSGLEASITDSDENSAILTNAQIVLESEDESKIQLRVDLTGDQTERVFDRTLISLGRTAPPVPGFRMQKGGKSSKIPKSFLVQILGEERVTKFVIQEILNSTMANYAKKENLDVKGKKVSTTQTAEELKKSFTPGKEFGFNVIIEPENSEDTT
ncbi:uncharacterized protein LOC130747410 [Lotus japonicus]|uniref:peptidylprolyl isomerase n=1 Tax=Lotus japonicus TaxID=34305 RepID=I3S2E8_LOTJA|nr:uncharacterized protein LOC130747410 [Lotus japonicus]AFK34440.1 unknown [Lotus japonicus]